MRFPRASGILLHPTSLPGPYGVGDLGPEAARFVEFLLKAGQGLWQVLPLSPTGYGNSPYQSISAFAGNPLLLSLDHLVEESLLSPSDVSDPPLFPRLRVDCDSVGRFKLSLLRKSFENFQNKASKRQRDELEFFCSQHQAWLDDYALFMALKERYEGMMWNDWDREIAFREPEAVAGWRERLSDGIAFQSYLQYQFFRQWSALKKHCNQHGIRIIGDIPIFVAQDSADVWSHPGLFYLDESGRPTVVAGVPPDYFSETGQFWGNPLYRWDVMAESGYSWWVQRFMATQELVDIIRVDHFRGFEGYWEVSARESTAINGRWVKGPGAAFFEAVSRSLGELPIIAEDLGVITPEVMALRDRFGFPGMRVLQSAFGNHPLAEEYLPHNYPRNCVVYTGTLDNNTTLGWFNESTVGDSTRSRTQIEAERAFTLKYLGTDATEINWKLVRLALASVADMAIVPLQDVLGLGGEARMNRPGTSSGNWEWRFAPGALTDEIAAKLRELTEIYGRTPAGR